MPDAPAPTAVLAPCPACGLSVLTGQTAQGALVALEPQTRVYTLIWQQGEAWPRLAQSRGYVAHACLKDSQEEAG